MADRGRTRLTRPLAGLSLAGLAIITAIVSYQHGLQVVRAAGNGGIVAYLVPLVADLMIFASSLALLEAAQTGQPRPPLAVVSLGFGISATIAMNVAAGYAHGAAGALVSALAPVALVLSYETLMGMLRRGHHEPAEPAEQSEVAAFSHLQPPPATVAQTLVEAVRAAHADGLSKRALAEQFEISRYRVDAILNQNGDDRPTAAEDEPVPSVPVSVNGLAAATEAP
jgi:hypothetical protein